MLGDDQVAVLRLPLDDAIAKSDSVVADIAKTDLVESRAVLVQSALSDSIYLPADEAPEILAWEKHLNAVRLCQILGAKKVTITQVNISERGEKSALKGGAAKLKVTGTVERASETETKNKSTDELEHTFPGGKPDHAAAREHILVTGLSKDPHLQALLTMSEGRNKLQSQKIKFSTDSESKKTLAWTAKVSVPFIEVTGRLEKVMKERRSYEFEFQVEF